MVKGTNKEILGKKGNLKEASTGRAGRPKVNRELAIRNLNAKDAMGNPRYTKAQVARMMGCTSKTMNRIYNEAKEKGLLTRDEKDKAIGVVEADFEAECLRAREISFRGWLETKFKTKAGANTKFNFCSKIWENVFDKCDLLEVADATSPLGDQIALKFVTTFQEDRERMRDRLKSIRYLFRFLRRQDLCDAHLSMSNTKHPRSKRRIPEISLTNFPHLYNECENRIRDELGNEAVLDIRIKLVTQMRTGDKKDEREFYGIQKGTLGKSYLSMVNPDEYQFHIFAKRSEEWDIIWMPDEVKKGLFERYERLNTGDQVAQTPISKLRKVWGDITEEVIGRRLILHDLRKVSLTWLYVMGVPLEVATQLNVGWLDLSTAHSHYIDIKKVLRKSFRKEYSENIPEWFKEGLEDFTGFEAVIEGSGSSALGAIQGTGHFGR